MSTPPGFVDEPPATTTDKVIEFLKIQSPAYWIYTLLSLLATPPEGPQRPVKAYQHPADAARQTFQGVYWALREMGVFHPAAYLGAMSAAVVVVAGGAIGFVLLWLFQNVMPEIASAGLDFIDAFRKQLDPQVAGIAVQVLNELLGTDYQEQHLPGGDNVEAHIARAGAIGNLFLNTITREIAPGAELEDVDGQAGAARFAGMIVNFGVATALLGLAGELSSAGLFKDFRLIGEQVSSGLGLSKQMRIAIKPLMKTLVATPFQWQLNRQFHPQRFSAAEVANPFAQTLMDHDTIVRDLELQGWSPERAEKLIRLHAKRLTASDVELFFRYGSSDRETAISALVELGYLRDVADAVLTAEDLRRADAVLRALVSAIETRVIDGQITTDEFAALLDTLPLGEHEKKMYLATVQYKVKAPHKSLTLAQVQKAFIEGILTLDQVSEYLTKSGYSADSATTLTLLTLLEFAQFEEAKKIAQFAYDQKVARAKAKGLPIPPPPKILAT
jgi:hypothetical protein